MSASVVYAGLLVLVMFLMSSCGATPARSHAMDDVQREVRPKPVAIAFAQERRLPDLRRSRGDIPRDR
ncbi:MAG: hypothetical protein ACJ790_13165 [Myxococcaceae bacterium]